MNGMKPIDDVETEGASGREYLDALGVAKRFGMSRSLVFKLAYSGGLPSISIRMPGAKQGKRIFRVAEVREFLRRHAGQAGSR